MHWGGSVVRGERTGRATLHGSRRGAIECAALHVARCGARRNADGQQLAPRSSGAGDERSSDANADVGGCWRGKAWVYADQARCHGSRPLAGDADDGGTDSCAIADGGGSKTK